ncbi:hypothetical protein CARUB_v10020850mg [Capsella rubella]|uniref:GIR1-like zinc ribbon domain-containing protein n=1 Tax=Capsella rubella TaxID=81985 RepID=R0GIT5_9BRAS|nr:uncharacterized protein LOC17895775 [Capsella rubella]EOA35636.1 hypothetical protein CARUB_v10020850mg [Capsella rubella]
MAADVSSLVRLLSGYKDERAVVKDSAGAKSTAALMTRDLLGSGRGGGGDRSLELDLDLQVPSGYEKRLDLKSGKVYLQRCNSTSSSTITNADQSNQTVPTFQDLNFPPNSSNNHAAAKPLLNLFDDTTLELKLLPSPARCSRRTSSLSPNTNNSNFQSVCTLDKVKSALERAERDPAMFKKRQSPDHTVSDHYRAEADAVASPVAAGCPGCLSYVLVMMNNPKCPRCDTIVPLAASSMKKKPKIDLNISI